MSAGEGLDARLVVRRAGGFALDLALRIAAGRTVALLGPNGAGKSTAVAALAGLVALDEGRVELAGRVLEDAGRGVFVPPERRRIGVVFQDFALFPHLTVLGNVAFGLRRRGRSGARVRELAGSWLQRFDLEDLADRRPAELSGGQAQRVALARSLAIEPDLLLLDEPLAALDVTTRVRLRRGLAAHLESFPGPRLLITHDPAEAFLLGDEICVLEDGRVSQVGKAEDIRLRPRTPYVADLAGANLFSGSAAEGVVTTSTGHRLRIADLGVEGAVLAAVHPRAVSIHLRRPEGSPRNAWPTSVERIEHLGERIRLSVGDPLPLAVEVTPEATAALDLEPGSQVWVSLKATEIRVEAA